MTLRWRLVLILVLLALPLSAAPARATVTTVSGYGVTSTEVLGGNDGVYLSLSGCAAVCEPGVVAAAGSGLGHADITIFGDHTLSVDVYITKVTLDSPGSPRVLQARGVGSDGSCWGINVLDGGPGDLDYLGLARAPIGALTAEAGPCVATQRSYVEQGDIQIEEI